MAAGAWRMTASGRTHLLNGDFDLDTDTWYCSLLASTGVIAASNDAFTGVSAGEVSTVSTGYASAAVDLVLSGSTQVKVDISADPVWTATADGFTARYAVIHESGANILCWAPLESDSSDVTITTGNTLTVAAAATGVFTLS